MAEAYVAVDLETTGLDPKKDKIIEIGACRVADGRITDTLSMFISPRRRLDERITEITGITDQMLEGSPGIEEVIGQVVDFCRGLPILGHHVIFDYSFLKRASINAGLEFEKYGIDTLSLCRRFMPDENKKNLAAACSFYGIINEEAHRALSDAKAAHYLYQKIKMSHPGKEEAIFGGKPLIYKVKKEQPATKRQKEYLRDLIKYHKIDISVQIDYMSRNEASRLTDKIISGYGRMKTR